jgi:hypothetical protein
MGITAVNAGAPIRAADINDLPVIESQLATGSLSNTVSETIIGTFTIGAGTIVSPTGLGLKLYITGRVTCTGTPTFVLRLRLNSLSGTTLNSISNTMGNTAAGFQYEGWLLFTAFGSSGSFDSLVHVAHNFTSGSVTSSADGQLFGTTLNTTVSNTLVVTGQFGAASTSNTASTLAGAMYLR